MALNSVRQRLNQLWAQSWFDPEHLEKRLIEEGLEEASVYARGILLDVGCGQRRHAHLFTPRVERYIGLDYPAVSEGIWAAAGGELVDIWADGQALPIAAGAVDTVLCTQVLEHVPEPARMTAEIARVLRPGGHALITVPQEWGLHQEPFDFYRFTRYGLAYLAEKAGLEVVFIHNRGGFWAMLAQRWSAFLYDATCRPLRRRGHRAAFVLTALVILPWVALTQLVGLGLDRIHHVRENTLGYVMVARKPA